MTIDSATLCNISEHYWILRKKGFRILSLSDKFREVKFVCACGVREQFQELSTNTPLGWDFAKDIYTSLRRQTDNHLLKEGFDLETIEKIREF